MQMLIDKMHIIEFHCLTVASKILHLSVNFYIPYISSQIEVDDMVGRFHH